MLKRANLKGGGAPAPTIDQPPLIKIKTVPGRNARASSFVIFRFLAPDC